MNFTLRQTCLTVTATAEHQQAFFQRSAARNIKGNADGARGIFGTAGRVWATALRPDPP